jgi:uncharacterized membrane protein YedE/YeeE
VLFGIVFGLFIAGMVVLILFVVRFAAQNGLRPPRRDR